MLRRRASEINHVNYERELHKGKLTAIANFEKVKFRGNKVTKVGLLRLYSDEGLTLETSAFRYVGPINFMLTIN